MKDILDKLTKLQGTAPKAKKKLTEDSTSVEVRNAKPKTFKDFFETVLNTVPLAGEKPGAGPQSTFLSTSDPQLAKTLGPMINQLAKDKKIQVVMPATQPNQPVQPNQQQNQQQNQTTQPNQPAQAGSTGQAPVGQQPVKEKWGADTEVSPSEKGKYKGKTKAELTSTYNKLKKSGPHKKGSPEYGRMRELAFAIRAKSDWGKVQEADIPSSAGVDTKGAGLGAGRSETTLEDKKVMKKKIKESANHRIAAARHEGRSHGLKGHSHCGKNYDDMDEAHAYHEGFKEGLDECYGMGVYESMPAMEADMPMETDMPMEDELDEVSRGEWLKQKAKTVPGNTFKAFGQTFHDDEVLETYPAFESWDRQLKSLINEGLSVSISKGLEGGHDSATVTATEGDADKLMTLIKSAGLGVFGGEETHMDMGADTPAKHGGIEVVGDHDGMMGLMKKLSNVSNHSDNDSNDDYEDEEESTCDDCGMHESKCGCSKEESVREMRCDECGMLESKCGCHEGKEMVDEVETEDQQTAQMAESRSESFYDLLKQLDALTEASKKEKKQAKDDSDMSDKQEKYFGKKSTKKDKEEVKEWANGIGGKGKDTEGKGTNAAFEQDIDFMTKVISGGLNKQKSTGQTTVPVIASQLNRTHSSDTSGFNESIFDFKTLAGIK
jgi:hypothetical protein